ncbi:MAG: type 4a pilus biogenesis protein PilO [Deltaproteobacteria bacterium]|nr:type 4a pilus biogenesis protein PilO [Deltaproteobacteria bacterium]
MAIPLKINLDSVIKLPLPKRIMILAAVNIVIVGAVYWFLIGPKYTEVKGLRGQLQELNVKLTENRLIAADIPKYIHDKEEMEDKLRNAVAQLPNEKEIPDLIDSISSAGEKSGLKILIFKPGKEVKKGFYAEVPVSMSVEGKFESLYDFSDKVGHFPRIVNISGMDILSTGHRNRVPVLKASFTATTFRFIPAPPEGAQAQGAPKK